MTRHRDPRVAALTAEVLARLRAAEGQPVAHGAGERAFPPGPCTARIDHTLLRPGATEKEIDRLVGEAIRHGFAAVCVNPTWVARCARMLRGASPRVATVVGFPLGAMHTSIKALEARRAVDLGADEIDMVLNQGELLAGRLAEVARDIAAVRHAMGRSATLKVILETGRLDERDARAGARVAVEAGADYLKTSTGFGPGGATVEAVRLLREVAGTRVGVKASGGIRTLADARAMIEAGATRLGTSSGVAIARGERSPGGLVSPRPSP